MRFYLDQNFNEIDYESLLGQNSSTDKRLQVSHCPFHFVVVQIDFTELIRWENHWKRKLN